MSNPNVYQLTIDRSNYNAKDEFCTNLDRRLSFWRQLKEAAAKDIPEPWWPFPDSRHSSSFETHAHRLSVVHTPDTPRKDSVPSPGSRLQRKKHRRKLSAEDICKETNPLRPLTVQNPDKENLKNTKDEKVQEYIRFEAAKKKTKEDLELLRPKEGVAKESFVFPQQAAPAKTRTQQLRQAAGRRQARNNKPAPIKTVYKSFDEDAFGTRHSTPSNPRRSSLLAAELKAEGEKVDTGQRSLFDMPPWPNGTRSEPAMKRSTSAPKSELRRDSALEDEKQFAVYHQPYDFGHQDIIF